MTESPEERSRNAWIVPIALGLAVIVIAFALGTVAEPPDIVARGGGRALPRVPAPPASIPRLLWELGVGSINWYGLAIATPFLIWGARKLDPERYGRLKVFTISAAVVTALIVITAAVQFLSTYPDPQFRPPVGSFVTVALRWNVLPWVALAGIIGASEARRRARRSVIERERLRAQIAEQRLIALTGQLQPHFLFNTLQGISTLIHRDPDAADEVLAKLADLLRDLLRHRNRAMVRLEDEIRYARTYLEIAKVRFAERLSFEILVTPDLDSAAVPLFILQPLIENALTHGVGGSLAGGRITITAERRDGRLQLEVSDNGAGMPGAAPAREGIGLANTRERLKAAFGGDQALSVGPKPGGGVVARIDVPYRVEEVVSA